MPENTNGYTKMKVKCPNCGKLFDIEIPPTIEMPKCTELKKKLMDRSMYMTECPDCHEKFKMLVPVSYIDDQKMVWICATEASQKQEVAWQMTHPSFHTGDAEMDQALTAMNNSLARRVVTDDDTLREKVMLFDLDLDDRPLELVKVMLRNMLKEKGIEDIIRVTAADIDEDYLDFQVYYREDGSMTRTSIQTQRQIYDYIADKNKDAFGPVNADEAVLTDREWAENCGIDPGIDLGETALLKTMDN